MWGELAGTDNSRSHNQHLLFMVGPRVERERSVHRMWSEAMIRYPLWMWALYAAVCVGLGVLYQQLSKVML
jgi:hypothetical protein